jgi:hypothetical protein
MPIPFQEGGCSCGQTRYQLKDAPLIIHACHCRMCQKLTGSTNAVNLLIEAAKVRHLQGETTDTSMPTPSGHGQVITRCKNCRVAIWSNYQRFSGVHGVSVRFIRSGTLDHPENARPDVHIFTKYKMPHVTPTDGKREFGEFYDLKDVWAVQSLERLTRGRNASNKHASK